MTRLHNTLSVCLNKRMHVNLHCCLLSNVRLQTICLHSDSARRCICFRFTMEFRITNKKKQLHNCTLCKRQSKEMFVKINNCQTIIANKQTNYLPRSPTLFLFICMQAHKIRVNTEEPNFKFIHICVLALFQRSSARSDTCMVWYTNTTLFFLYMCET